MSGRYYTKYLQQLEGVVQGGDREGGGDLLAVDDEDHAVGTYVSPWPQLISWPH